MRFRGRREAVAHARYCKLQKSRDKLRDAGNCIEYTTLACGIATLFFYSALDSETPWDEGGGNGQRVFQCCCFVTCGEIA